MIEKIKDDDVVVAARDYTTAAQDHDNFDRLFEGGDWRNKFSLAWQFSAAILASSGAGESERDEHGQVTCRGADN